MIYYELLLDSWANRPIHYGIRRAASSQNASVYSHVTVTNDTEPNANDIQRWKEYGYVSA